MKVETDIDLLTSDQDLYFHSSPEFWKKLFVNRLDKFIEEHNLLSDRQYDFRANRSTSMAVMELVEGIIHCNR